MREALDRAMGHEHEGHSIEQLQASGLAVADEDTMTQAIHDVYCGIVADHQHPNQKDREQARALIAAIRSAQGGSSTSTSA